MPESARRNAVWGVHRPHRPSPQSATHEAVTTMILSVVGPWPARGVVHRERRLDVLRYSDGRTEDVGADDDGAAGAPAGQCPVA